MKESDLVREQEWWEQKEADAQRAVEYAGRQIERIVQKIVELRAQPERHLSIVQDHVQVVLLHGGETE